MKLSIVIPLYNSEKSINEVIERTIITMDTMGYAKEYEIILVNDNSKDNTFEICKSLCTKNNTIKLINFSKNFGQHHALLAGFNYVRGEYIVCLDDDLQNPPEEIPKLISEIIKNDYDVVFGQYEQKKHSVFRNFGSQLNKFMAVYLINQPKNINISSFFVCKLFVIEEIVKYDCPYPYIGGLILRVTQNMGNVIVSHNSRQFGNSNYSLRKLVLLWLNGFTNFSVLPLRLASMLGILLALISFVLIIVLVIKRIINPDVAIGWTSIIVTVAFLGGVQLLSIGMLGEYIGRIYLSVNKTPQYVIRETVNVNNDI